jgi:hypothetical protein
MSREYDAVLAALDTLEDEVTRRYRGGLEHEQYMKNVGRHEMVDTVRDAVKKLKKRGGDDDGDQPRGTGGRPRRGVSTDDWGPTPGEAVDESGPF